MRCVWALLAALAVFGMAEAVQLPPVNSMGLVELTGNGVGTVFEACTGLEREDDSTTELVFDGSEYIALSAQRQVLQFATGNTVVPLQTFNLTLPLAAGPFVLAADTCTTSGGCVSGGGLFRSLPLLVGRRAVWPLLFSEADDVTLVLGHRILNTFTDPALPCVNAVPTNLHVGQELTEGCGVCTNDLVHVAQRNDYGALTFSLFFQLSGQGYVFQGEGVMGTDLPVQHVRVIGTLASASPAFGSTVRHALSTCTHLYWADHRSTDLFALRHTGQPLPLLGVPYRITTGVAGTIGSLQFAIDSLRFVGLAQGVTYRLPEAPLVALLEATAPFFPDACAFMNGGCNVTGGHVCVSNAITGVLQCLCPDPTQHSRPSGCYDLDECALGLDTCPRPATTCANRAGGYDCLCADRFTSTTGLSPCTPRGACPSTALPCPPPSLCTMLSTGPTCVCAGDNAMFIAGTHRGECRPAFANVTVPLSEDTGVVLPAAAGTAALFVVNCTLATAATTTSGYPVWLPLGVNIGVLYLLLNNFTFSVMPTGATTLFRLQGPGTVTTLVLDNLVLEGATTVLLLSTLRPVALVVANAKGPWIGATANVTSVYDVGGDQR